MKRSHYLKKDKFIAEQEKGAIKSMDAGRGTVTELAEINAAMDKAAVDLIRARQYTRLELNELQFFSGEKITKIKTLNKDINNFEMFKKPILSGKIRLL